jgi:ABC-type nitrate/sulfonate/bicarbonate transport system substrate-binding protein
MTSVPFAAASKLKRLSVNVFPAGFIWPLWVGQEKGFFARHGLEIELIHTVNSVQQMTGLIDGAFDLAMTAIDNVIAYMEGQGEAATSSKPDIVSVMGSSSGFLSLIVAPHIRSFDDLKGTTLSVDAMTTGYAFTLRRMLAMRGLDEDDYRLVKVGGMKERYEALVRNEQAGTLLVPPFTLMARDKGFNELDTVLGVMKHFQGGVAAVRRDWLATHQDEAVGFICGNLAALEWLYDPANKAQALEIFMARMNNTSQRAAEQSYAVLLDPLSGFPRRANIDLEGVDTVIDIRRTYAEPRRPLSDASAYYDPRYYSRALQRYGGPATIG